MNGVRGVNGANEEALSLPPPKMNGVDGVKVEGKCAIEEALLPPPPPVPVDVVQLLTNHAKVNQTNTDGYFCHYHALKRNDYAEDPLLYACGVSVTNTFTQVEGRVLSAPRLKVGNGEDFFPLNGRWIFNKKKLVDPKNIEVWAVVNFSAQCNTPGLIKDLIKCGGIKGINIDSPFDVFEESPHHRHASPLVRVEKMFESIAQSKFLGALQFLLCILPEKKNSLLYAWWIEFRVIN